MTADRSKHTRVHAGYAPVRGPTFHEMLLHQPMAWTQWTVPVFNQTRSPGRWMNRYTGTLASYKSSRFGHHEPFRKLMLFLQKVVRRDT